MSRRVLFLQRSFSPEISASGEMLRRLAVWLAERGWEPHVVCAIPESRETPVASHPGVHVHRTPGISYWRGNRIARVISMWRSCRAMESVAKRCPAPDVVVSLTDPPGAILIGDCVARHHRAAHVHWSQDVYPEIAVRLGVVSASNPYIRHLEKASARAMTNARRVVSIGRCMTRVLMDRGIPAERVVMIPNWANPAPGGDPVPVREEFGIPAEARVLLYSGNFGLAHEFETVMDCAALPGMQNTGWHFVFAGAGARRNQLEVETARRNLRNTLFLPHLENSAYSALSRAADMHLVTLDPRIEGCMVPSKFYAALACGRPVAYVGPPGCEAALTLQSAQAGISVRNGAANDLAAALQSLSGQPDALAGMSRRALAASGEFTVAASGTAFQAVLESAVSAPLE